MWGGYRRFGWILLIVSFLAHAQPYDYRLDGEWIQGGLITGHVSGETKLRLDGDTVFVDQDGFFVLGLQRDAPATVTLEFLQRGEVVGTERFQVAQRDYDIQKVYGIAQNIMQPSTEDQERIAREAALVARARETFLLDRNFLDNFVKPVEGPLTGVYGSQRFYNDVPGTPHYGIDFAGPVGTPVGAPAPGLVILAEPNLFYSGGTIIIDHGYGVSSTLMHLSSVDVEAGQRVAQGDIIGKIGATGRASGPHLDWRMNWKGVRIDPQLLLDRPLKYVE